MNERIQKSINEPLRTNPSMDERWFDSDKGLITCWEVGRKLAKKEPDLVERIMNGELPTLGVKGGVEKKIQKKSKYGTLYYLAQLQGISGQNLNLDLSEEPSLTCSKTGMTVTYTMDVNKYANS